MSSIFPDALLQWSHGTFWLFFSWVHHLVVYIFFLDAKMSSSSKFHFCSPFANTLGPDAFMTSITSVTSLSHAITSFSFCWSCLSSSSIVSCPVAFLTNNCGFNSVWFMLSVFTPFFRSGCRDRASGRYVTPGLYTRVKSKHDKKSDYRACQWERVLEVEK